MGLTHKHFVGSNHLANGYVAVPRASRKCSRYVFKFVVGILLGILFTSLLKTVIKVQSPRFIMCTKPGTFAVQVHSDHLAINRTNSTIPEGERGLLLVGVMTAEKYVRTRARAVYETWGKTVPGKILFFTAAGTESFDDLPIVPLPGVDDSYPPQKKSFLMLKYMHDNYRDKYEWFMRADDDVFVRMDKLETFLRDVNSSNSLFIGQAGKGIQEEFGLLSLEYDENFCMGGPGVIMSHVTLSRVAPHVKDCLHNLYTTHEDVELGRCVQKFAGVPCTWSYEMQNIFYHNSSGRSAFTGTLKSREVHRAITLHPVKQFSHMYRLHNYLQGVAIQDLTYESFKIRRQRAASVKELHERLGSSWNFQDNEKLPSLVVPPALNKFLPKSTDEVLSWDFISRAAYSVGSANPRRRFESSMKEGIDDVVREVMESINTLSKERGRIMDFKDILYGYYRLNPRYGIDYILDMLLVYKKYRGRKMTVPVRRHAYLQQPFGPVQIRQTKGVSEAEIYFILPIAGRLEIFERFMKNYIDVCVRQDQNTKLIVVLFQTFTEDDPKEHIKDLIESYRNMFQAKFQVEIVEADGPFARAVALEQGSEMCNSDDCLLFFVDVDMAFTLETLRRIRLHTIQSHQTYFPIVFSQYDTSFLAAPSRQEELFDVIDSRGYWRFYGFGIASIYRSDLRSAGGFNTTIKGWGHEDVDLFDRILTQTNLTVFRAPDVGLVHVFHAVHCASDLEAKQKEMCLGTKANTIASQHQLARYFIENNN